MGSSLTEIAQELIDANKKVQLIYAFNGIGKTRLSRQFKFLLEPSVDEDIEEKEEELFEKVLYYNAYTEDLFHWENNSEDSTTPKLKVNSNTFTEWIIDIQEKEKSITNIFQNFTDDKLTPNFIKEDKLKNINGKKTKIQVTKEITFSYTRGNKGLLEYIKISKGEESSFIWSIFYSLIEDVINVRSEKDLSLRETDKFDKLEYIFIDDPVSSLDDNHLIELAVKLAKLIKISNSKETGLKFILTTHNPLFYNVLYNKFNKGKFNKYIFKKNEDGSHELINQNSDSPFSYHLFLVKEIDKAIKSEELKKYHFNFLRNILEKTSTFLGYNEWKKLLPKDVNYEINPYHSRKIDISSHSKYSGDEITELTSNDKKNLIEIFNHLITHYKFCMEDK